METLVSPSSVRPLDLDYGNVMLRTIKIMILQNRDGLCFRAYLCEDNAYRSDNIPQGSRLPRDVEAQMPELFSALKHAEIPQDPY